MRFGIILFFLVLAAAVPPVHSQSWGPWSASSDAPALQDQTDRDIPSTVRASSHEHSIAGTPFIWMMKGYQQYISPVDGDRCPMYPTCSQYSIEAIRKHGPVLGIIMTVDRLMHEADEREFAPVKKIGNRYRFLDPVAQNDFWWAK